jgi:hypothetical protein
MPSLVGEPKKRHLKRLGDEGTQGLCVAGGALNQFPGRCLVVEQAELEVTTKQCFLEMMCRQHSLRGMKVLVR